MNTKHFLLGIVLLCSASLYAATFEVDGINYSTLGGDSVSVCSRRAKYVGAITIPETVQYEGITYRVTAIGRSAFAWCSALYSVSLPNSITTIDSDAFSNCTALTSITIPSGVTNCTANNIFYECSALTNVVWNAKNCNGYPFFSYSSQKVDAPITSFIIGDSVEYIPANLCKGMKKLTSISIPKNVSSIGTDAFKDCAITKVNIENLASWCKIEFSGEYSNPMKYSSTLYINNIEAKNLIIPDGVTKIGQYTFCYGNGINSITVSNSVKQIETNAFYRCQNLKTITIGSNVTTMPQNAFYGCTNIGSAILLPMTPPEGNGSIPATATILVRCQAMQAYSVYNDWKTYGISSYVYKLTAKSNDEALGNVMITQLPSCDNNEIGIMQAQPTTGNIFVEWNDGNIENPRSVSVQEDMTFTAIFAPYIEVNSLSLDKATLTIAAGDSYTLVPTISPADATNQNIKWTSSNADIAYVYNGTVTALSNGRAVITAETEDGHFTASCIVTVADPVSVTGITLSETSVNMQIGDTHQLTATVLPANAANKNYTWKTDDATIATVENGLITAVNYGKTTITATTEDGGKTATCEVEVGVPVAGITLDQTEIIIAPGASKKLTATVEPENATNKTLTWTSSDENVAAVANGWVIGVAEGTATITATTEDGGFKATCKVIVTTPVNNISLDFSSVKLTVGTTKQLNATIYPADASNQNVTWVSNNTNVATVENGLVTAIGNGTAIITATTEDGAKSAQCSIVVTTSVSGITLDASEVDLLLGEEKQLTATITPAEASNKDIVWTSSDRNIATVQDGLIKTHNVGTATITVKTVDGNYTATCIVNVKPIVVTGVSLDLTAVELEVGQTKQVLATVTPANATNQNIVWSTNNAAVATVENGVITAVGAGIATITVTTEDGNYTASCEVSVTDPAIYVTGITIDQTELSLFIGTTQKLTVTITPEDATNKNVVWTTSDASVALIENGWVIALAKGQTTITATTEDGGYTATCTVTVTDETALDNVSADGTSNVQKIFDNGTIYILRNGEKYTVDGRKIK